MSGSAPESVRRGRVLVARLDSLGDLLLAGPAVRAVAAQASTVAMLVGTGRTADARLLPGVQDVIEFDAPWIVFNPGPVRPEPVDRLVETVRDARFDAALILTSFHQSPLPLALLLRLARIGWIGAISEDYPGSLLDLRHKVPASLPESERGLSLARAAGFQPDCAGARLAVRRPLPDVSRWTGLEPYLVFHPGAAVSSRRPTAAHSRAMVSALADAGHRVLVTGSSGERSLAGYVAADRAQDLSGQLDVGQLAAVLDGAGVAIAPNTGPAHLAAAVGTPVVSLFAPVVPARNWAPYGVPSIVLGNQDAACKDTRARNCPLEGHPCLSSIDPQEVVEAAERLVRSAGQRRSAAAGDATEREHREEAAG
jgi:ADP-heptose:LPS heptosyltransferase